MPERGPATATASQAVPASTMPRIVNNFLHDTCTGAWLGSLIVIWTLWAQASALPPEARAAVALAATRVWWLLLVSLTGLAITGGIRLRYWRAQAAPEELAEKRKALIWKHVAFLLVYGAGSVWAWWMLSSMAVA